MASLMGGIPDVRALLSARADAAARCALDFLLFRDVVQDHTAELQQARGVGLGLEHTAELQQAATWYGMVWCGVVWCGMVWYGVVWSVQDRTLSSAPRSRRARRSTTWTPTGATGGTRWCPRASTAW